MTRAPRWRRPSAGCWRWTAVKPEQLRRQLRLNGPHEATVVLTRVAGAQSVLVVEPLG